MRRLGEWLRGLYPRRRLRSWRYVSPRRHSAGFLILLVVVAGVSGYWRLTNESQIRRQAKAYLVELTGGDWRVGHAHFSLFSGVELRDVKLYTPGVKDAFFEANRVVLLHRPWGLLAHRRLDVREVRCEGAAVRLARDPNTGEALYPLLRFSPEESQAPPSGEAKPPWPPLTVSGARIQRWTWSDGILRPRPDTVADISGATRGDDLYQVVLMSEEKGGASSLQGAFWVSMATGEVGGAGIATVLDANSAESAELARLGIRGRVWAQGRWDPQTRQGYVEANLVDCLAQLPPEAGGLRLHAVRGLLSVDANGIFVRGLSGRVEQAGDARLLVSGWCAGLEPNAALEFRVRVEGLEVPASLDGNGLAAQFVQYVNDRYPLKGRLTVEANLSRAAGGDLRVCGTASGKGLSVMDRSFPYQLHDVQTEVAFTDRQVEFRRFQGSHGSARIEVEGAVRFPPEGKTLDLLLRATDVAVDDDLRNALLHGTLPAARLRAYDALSPSGKISARVRTHLDAPGEREKQEVALLLGGAASMEYSGFPYPLQSVYGEVGLVGDRIEMRGASCTSPGMTGTLDGYVRPGAGGTGEANLLISASLPLDKRLERALGKPGQAAFRALSPAGMARIDRARVWQEPGQEVQFRVPAEVEGGSFTFDRFPYSLTNAAGSLLFEPNRVTVHGLVGRHKDTLVAVRGSVFPDSDGNGNVRIDLQVDANGLRIDTELFEALPPALQRAWRDMEPSGLADLGLHLGWGNLDDPNTLDYACTIRGRDVQLKYAGFPYALRGLRGTALILSDRVELRDVTAEKGSMRLALSGIIPLDGGGKGPELTLKALDVPLDAELLGALPAGAGLFGRLRPGGTCSLDLTRLRLSLAALAASAPASAPGEASGRPFALTSLVGLPASAPGGVSASAPASDWLLEGELSLKDAEANLGTLAKLTGSLAGRIEQKAGRLAIDANIFVANLTIQERVITEMRGQMRKEAASPLIHIDDIVGKAYGGRLAGFAEIRLGEPLEYAFYIAAEKMNLREVFRAGAGEANEGPPVEGLLDATIKLIASEGNRPSRQVSGSLILSKAKFQKLPVLVNLLEPLFLSLPGESYTGGAVEYTLKEDKILFREIHLQGQGLSLVGSGSMDLKNDALKITFLSRPGALPRMQNLADELLGVLLRELAEVQVTGTLKNPRFRTLPLRNINDIVKQLTRPEAD